MARRYPWLKLWCDVRTDAKIALLDDHEFRVFVNLLVYSAEREPRGVIDASDFTLLAIECSRADEAILTRTIERLRALRIVEVDDDLSTIAFRNFAERQYEKPSDRPEAVAERVRRHRERNDV